MPNQLNHPHTKLRHQSGKPSCRQQAALLFLSLYLLAPGTYAQAPVTLDIPAQPLGAALESLARSAGLQLVYPPELVGQRRSAGLHGEYTSEQAMSQLLEGSGLEFQMIDEHTVAIKKPEPVAQNDAIKAVPKKTGQDQPTVLEEITVTASPLDETSYNPPNATTATKTDTPIMETPVSVQVVPQQVLKDQQAISIGDALKNVSGVQSHESYGSAYDNFIVRGFSTEFSTYRNGLRQYTLGFETTNLQQIEVLKGPAAVLFGRIEPGGLINPNVA